MFTEQQIKALSRRRGLIALAGILGAVLAVALYLGAGVLLLAWLGDQMPAVWRQRLGAWGMLPSLPLFLTIVFLNSMRAERVMLLCPHCQTNILRRSGQTLVTGCCPACHRLVVEGRRARSPQIYSRWLRWQNTLALPYLLWVWAIGQTALVLWSWLLFAWGGEYPPQIFLFPLLGSGAAGWVWLRTWDRRAVVQFLISSVLLLISGWLFWKSIGACPD